MQPRLNSSLARGADHRYTVEDAHEIKPGSYTHILMSVYCGKPLRPGQYRMKNYQNFKGFPGAFEGQPVCLCILPTGVGDNTNLAIRAWRKRLWIDITEEWEIENGRREPKAPAVPGAVVVISDTGADTDGDTDGDDGATDTAGLTLAGLGITIKAEEVPMLEWEDLKALAVSIPGINASGRRVVLQAKVIAALEELGA